MKCRKEEGERVGDCRTGGDIFYGSLCKAHTEHFALGFITNCSSRGIEGGSCGCGSTA